MQQASQNELITRDINDMLSQLSRHILPNMISWIVIALLFIVVGVMIVRGRRGMVAATIQILSLGGACSVVIGFLHYRRSFGEVFEGGIDRFRAPIHFGLTMVSVVLGIYFSYRRRQTPTNHRV